MTPLQQEIEQRLSASNPDVDVLLVEQSAPDTLRIFIDHPDGVSLTLCERVTSALGDLRERFALEVSSPGPRRPLSRPAHFQRYVGRRAKVRSSVAPRSVVGELVGASDSDVTIASEGGLVEIPYSAIQRSHLVEE
ncbi:MAG: ribosome maturation factor RimP [Solirubrobacteraceae bacterium]